LVDASGRDKVHLVGHDWGAVVAWQFARQFPERLKSLAILNGPSSSIMVKHLRESWDQRRRSWYMLFFQLPVIPEMVMSSGNWRLGLRALQSSGRPQTFDSADLEMYRRAWSRPMAMTSMINWYRAMRFSSNRRAPRRIRVPTLLLWGARDTFLREELARQSIDYCENGRLVYLEEASHWVQHDEFEKVNQLLVGFLTDGFREEE
jgi:pimeloyl-ACP methyl ester carboxylesterase